MNEYQAIAEKWRLDYERQMAQAKAQGADAGRIRRLELRLAACRKAIEALVDAEDKEDAINALLDLDAEYERNPLSLNEQHARSEPLMVIRGDIAKL